MPETNTKSDCAGIAAFTSPSSNPQSAMEIVLAESLGFCMGVKRAVDMAYRAIEKADSKVTDEDAIPDNSTVISRAHGVTPQAMQSLKSRGLKVMDGTCPYV